MMNKASEQLPEETTYPNLAEFLRAGGTMEVGHDQSIGSFAQIRKGNKTISIQGVYRDFEAVLEEMNSAAKEHFPDAPATPNH